MQMDPRHDECTDCTILDHLVGDNDRRVGHEISGGCCGGMTQHTQQIRESKGLLSDVLTTTYGLSPGVGSSILGIGGLWRIRSVTDDAIWKDDS